MDTEEGMNCQITNIPQISEGPAPVPPESLLRKLRLFIRRNISAKQVRYLKTRTGRIIQQIRSKAFGKGMSESLNLSIKKPTFSPGDIVRVKSREEIQATLNSWGQLNGCMFMSNEMTKYCNTNQRVFKNLERFIDERDYRVKKSHGVVFLDGVFCEGTTDYGRCDRSCFFFWREEWLEKIDTKE